MRLQFISSECILILNIDWFKVTSIFSSRIKFMLEIVLAVKNNNMAKIPNYDTSYSEHLKKVIKGLIRKGNYITQLNISLEDLLKGKR